MNSKTKGNAYERDLCRKISLWITGGSRDDTVWRSASSGAVHTVRSRKKTDKGDYLSQVGDLCSIDPLSEFFFHKIAIEAKRYADLQFGNMLCGVTSKASEFWKVHEELCRKANKEPWLIAKQNRKPDLLFLSTGFFLSVSERNQALLKTVAIAHFPGLRCSVYVLDDFLKTFSYNDLFGSPTT